MRRLTAAMLLAFVVIAPACRTRRKGARAVDDGKPLSVVKVGDPRGAVQLIRGFHNVENGSWRWVTKNFTASLHPPAGSATNGATLELKFTLPEAIFSQLGAMTIRARVAATDLTPETYSKAGDYTYSRDLPPSALQGDMVTVEFFTDKALPPSATDDRELSIIVTSAGLLAKQLPQ
jgi:hypothetical protein